MCKYDTISIHPSPCKQILWNASDVHVFLCPRNWDITKYTKLVPPQKISLSCSTDIAQYNLLCFNKKFI